MKRRIMFPTLCISLLFLFASGCGYEPETSYVHGAAYNNLFAAQVINWNAPRDPSPPDGMPGFISEGIFAERYTNEIIILPEDQQQKDNEDSGKE